MDEAIKILEKHVDDLVREIGCLPSKEHRARRDLQARADTFAHACLILRRSKDRQTSQQTLPLEEKMS